MKDGVKESLGSRNSVPPLSGEPYYYSSFLCLLVFCLYLFKDDEVNEQNKHKARKSVFVRPLILLRLSPSLFSFGCTLFLF
ncbi:MAG: hypothetical protein JOS17DRAFT_746571 [Linnemannia elongata]|nr:MAG: hypothetical protein JOS17DRAFT_746571 [Linnemannia elongata]